MIRIQSQAVLKILNVCGLVLVLVGSFGVGFAGTTYPVWGQMGPTLPVFGGVIVSVLYCPCSGGYIDYVGPPRMATVYVQEGLTLQFSWYLSATPGVWTLGDYFPGQGQCRVYSPYSGCNDVYAQGTERQNGTSL